MAIYVGPQVQQLAEDRLGIESTPQSVLAQARKLGVTRARVYQLLESCMKVMDVRWPEGRVSLGLVADKFARQGIEPRDLRLFHAVRELFFPAPASTAVELPPSEPAGGTLERQEAEAN